MLHALSPSYFSLTTCGALSLAQFLTFMLPLGHVASPARPYRVEVTDRIFPGGHFKIPSLCSHTVKTLEAR